MLHRRRVGHVAHSVVARGLHYRTLMPRPSSSFLRRHKSRPDPDGLGTQCERSHQTSAQSCGGERRSVRNDAHHICARVHHRLNVTAHRPSKIPPAPTTAIGPPWRGDVCPSQMSTHCATAAVNHTDYDSWLRNAMSSRARITCGMSTVVAMSPVWPPASVPCAQTASTPAASALTTCFGDPTMFITSMPALCSRSTTAVGGTPTCTIEQSF